MKYALAAVLLCWAFWPICGRANTTAVGYAIVTLKAPCSSGTICSDQVYLPNVSGCKIVINTANNSIRNMGVRDMVAEQSIVFVEQRRGTFIGWLNGTGSTVPAGRRLAAFYDCRLRP